MTNASTLELDEVGNSLLASASKLLAQEGAGALTVRRIAADAGMSTMNVYSRFGGKNGVVEQLFLRGFELLAQGMHAVATTDDPIADLTACGAAYRRFALEHTTLYSVMFDRVVPDYEPTPAALASGLATLRQLADRLQRCIDAGLVRPIAALHGAAMLWATCHGAVSLELKGKLSEEIDWAQVFADSTMATLRGMGA